MGGELLDVGGWRIAGYGWVENYCMWVGGELDVCGELLDKGWWGTTRCGWVGNY